MEKIAVFPGSFDPITKGHESVIRRALPLFDKIIIAVGDNQEKNHFFPVNKRIELLNTVFSRKLLKAQGLLVVEHEITNPIAEEGAHYSVLKQKKMGRSLISILEQREL